MSSAAVYTPVDTVFAVLEDGPFSSNINCHVAFLRAEAQHFFHPETAACFGLDSPADRFYVGRDRMSCGLDVPSGMLLLVDDIHNWKIAILFSVFTKYGVCIIPFVLNHLGITHMEEDRIVHVNVHALPWLTNGAPICSALTCIFDFWVLLNPHRALEHAHELGMPSRERWFVQTNGVVYWVELKNMRGELCHASARSNPPRKRDPDALSVIVEESLPMRTRGDGWAHKYFNDITVFKYKSDGAQSA
ncbi:hypothetical protein EXIGLDRAFT_691940 [Exidia glandulosa HHB12029]|uniref:Uncharacterized protein n=1 Tax=Exidia glandulosa HHB12029 TaxID=1314781 RepID=A0A165IBW6_EXIGL|nr:hypothetical protein EXIGLDRAFT_691940 [Exidia glandulosa HHB12029]